MALLPNSKVALLPNANVKVAPLPNATSVATAVPVTIEKTDSKRGKQTPVATVVPATVVITPAPKKEEADDLDLVRKFNGFKMGLVRLKVNCVYHRTKLY